MKTIVKSSNNHYTQEDVEIKEIDNFTIVIPTEPFIVRHAEHAPIPMEKQEYIIRKVVECDPLSKQTREVAD